MKLIIIDDSRLIRVQLERSIKENFDDLEIYQAADGDEGLNAIFEYQPDIIFLDILMPGLTGTELLEKIQPLTRSGLCKVLMISSIEDYSILQECFTLGAYDFIRKPVNEIELNARLGGAISSTKLVNKLRESEADLEGKVEEIERVNQKLIQTKNQMIQSEKMAAIGQLAAGVAHEINNPIGYVSSNLVTLKGYISDLLSSYQQTLALFDHMKKIDKTDFESTSSDAIDFIIDDIPGLFEDTEIGLTRVKEIVDGLRNFSRVDQAMEFDVFDVNEGIKDTLVVTKNKYKYLANIETNFGALPLINAKGGKLNQVFMNLIVNACDAIASKFDESSLSGWIKITTRQVAEHVKITFEDNGTGIDKEIVEYLYNPFFTTKPIGQGTGLGLSISYDIIVNEHKGSIAVESTENVGSTFILTLPINPDGKEVI